MKVKKSVMGLLITSGLLVIASNVSGSVVSPWETILAEQEVVLNADLVASLQLKKRPLQEAIDACNGKSEGDSCEFKNKKGEQLTGTCKNHKGKSEKKQLICKVNKGKGNKGDKGKKQKEEKGNTDD